VNGYSRWPEDLLLDDSNVLPLSSFQVLSKRKRKATIGPVMSARPSITNEERLSDLTDFCKISYSGLLKRFVKISQK
jgi:hypothetical protein